MRLIQREDITVCTHAFGNLPYNKESLESLLWEHDLIGRAEKSLWSFYRSIPRSRYADHFAEAAAYGLLNQPFRGTKITGAWVDEIHDHINPETTEE
jgi:hypothetical protein